MAENSVVARATTKLPLPGLPRSSRSRSRAGGPPPPPPPTREELTRRLAVSQSVSRTFAIRYAWRARRNSWSGNQCRRARTVSVRREPASNHRQVREAARSKGTRGHAGGARGRSAGGRETRREDEAGGRRVKLPPKTTTTKRQQPPFCTPAYLPPYKTCAAVSRALLAGGGAERRARRERSANREIARSSGSEL